MMLMKYPRIVAAAVCLAPVWLLSADGLRAQECGASDIGGRTTCDSPGDACSPPQDGVCKDTWSGCQCLAATAPDARRLSGVVLEQRADGAGHQSLLVTVPGVLSGRVVDEARLRLPRDAARQARAVALPRDWTTSRSDRVVSFRRLDQLPAESSGEAALRLHLSLGDARLPQRLPVELLSGGETLLEQRVEVTALPALQTANTLSGTVAVPPQVSPGDQILIRPHPRLGPVTLYVNGLRATAGAAAGGPGSPLHRVRLPEDLEPGSTLDVVAIDHWGDPVVSVRQAREIRVVPPPDLRRPGLTGATRLALVGSDVCVCGPFPSADAVAGLRFEGAQPELLAASSSCALFDLGPEPARVRITADPAAGFSAAEAAQLDLVAVTAALDEEALWVDQTTVATFDVAPRGARVELDFLNASPEVIETKQGDHFVVEAPGTVKLFARRRGDFNLHWQLVTEPCPCLGPVRRAADTAGEGATRRAFLGIGGSSTCGPAALGHIGTYDSIKWKTDSFGWITFYPESNEAYWWKDGGSDTGSFDANWWWDGAHGRFGISFRYSNGRIYGHIDPTDGSLSFNWYKENEGRWLGRETGELRERERATKTNRRDNFEDADLDAAKTAPVEFTSRQCFSDCDANGIQALLAERSKKTGGRPPSVGDLLARAHQRGWLTHMEADQPITRDISLDDDVYKQLAAEFGWNVYSLDGDDETTALAELRRHVTDWGHPVMVGYDTNVGGDPIAEADYATGCYAPGKRLHIAIVQGFITDEHGIEYVIVKQPWEGADRVWRLDDFLHSWALDDRSTLVAGDRTED